MCKDHIGSFVETCPAEEKCKDGMFVTSEHDYNQLL